MLIRLLCKILKFIEEILMKLIPSICGDSRVHLPSICGEIGYFKGVADATIKQGTDFDLLAGVEAYNSDGELVPFSVSPSEVASCEVGTQTFTYTSEDATKERKITVTQIASPTINGIGEAINVSPNVEFDPLEGVSAIDGNGNPVTVTVRQLETATLCASNACESVAGC